MNIGGLQSVAKSNLADLVLDTVLKDVSEQEMTHAEETITSSSLSLNLRIESHKDPLTTK